MTVLVHRTMSLDGYIAGPEHEMDWIFEHDPPDDLQQIIAATGAIVIGRGSWQVGARDTGKPSGAPYGGAWSGPIFVLTSKPLDAGPGVTVVAGDIGDVIVDAQAAAGHKKVELFGANVAAQALRRGLVDEILVHVAPVLLGDGIPFSPGSGRIPLEPAGATQSGDMTHLRFRVRSAAAAPPS